MNEHREAGNGYLILSGLVGVLMAVAALVLVVRQPLVLAVVIVLAVAMIGAAAGAIYITRRVNK